MSTYNSQIKYLFLFLLLIYSINSFSNSISNSYYCNDDNGGGYLLPSPIPSPLSSATIFCWFDYNEDGIKQSNEGGVEGISLQLYNENSNLVAVGSTGADGVHVFTNIPNGTYRVKFNGFAGLIYTYQNIGTDDNLDSDIDITGYSDELVISQPSDSYYITGGFRGNLQVFLGNTRNICLGEQVTLEANTHFGKGPFSYEWNNGLGNNKSIIVSPSSSKSYRVTVSDTWGFQTIGEVLVRVKNGVGEEQYTYIDYFNSGSGNNSFSLDVDAYAQGFNSGSDYSDHGILGNYRNVELTYISGTHPASIEIDYNSGKYSHSNDVGTISYGSLCYNRNNAGLNEDISSFEYFKFKDISIDQGEVMLVATVKDFANNTATISKKLPGLGSNTIYDVELMLEDFSGIGNIDKTNIQEICFDFTSQDASIDFGFGDIWLCIYSDCNIKPKFTQVEICEGDSIDISADVECAENIQFYWDNNLGAGSSHRVSPSETTTYYATATDVLGCESTDTVRVVVHKKPIISLPDKLEMCKGDSIDITVDISVGKAPYSYLWSTGDTTKSIRVSPESNIFYTAVVTDANNCAASQGIVSLEVFPTPELILTSTIANCAENDGSASANASGGTPPYSFEWNTGDTGKVLQNIPAGTYIVTVTDSNGCSAEKSVNVEEKDCGLIGNYVWEDMNADGIQDSGEPSIPNVQVILYDEQSNPLDTAYTDANGFYYFYSLFPAGYYVKFIKPQDFNPTLKDIGNDALDCDADPLTGLTTLIDIEKYEKDSTIDAGYYKYASIGDTVWVDKDGDGKQSPPELGVENFEVQLLDCNGNILQTTFTDINGKYEFSSLVPGEYKVKFVLKNEYKFTLKNVGNNSNKDSDADPITGETDCESLESGEKNYTYDGGVYIPAKLGNFVWEDLNADGIQDIGEPGIENIAVILNDCNNNPLDTTYTDADGFYLFDDLFPGGYKISLIKPNDYILSTANVGDDNKDSDILPDGYSVCEDLESGETNLSYDIGIYRNASIGDFIWLDKNANGIQDNDEIGVDNVLVELQDCNGNLLNTMNSDATGKYLFGDLKPGNYRIKFHLLNDYNFTSQNIGNDTLDSDASLITGITSCENLISGENNMTYDAGIYQYAKIGDKVWLDENGDGQQDPNEDGFENVEVKLMDCNGTIFETQFTDINGFYLFDNLVPGNYKIKFISPLDYSFSIKDNGDDTLDSDPDLTTGITDCETLESGEDNRTYDAGLLYFGSLGDYVWEDLNGDGLQDNNEPNIEDVEIKLFKWVSNSYIYQASDFTDSDGKYLFETLPPGDYYIEVVPPVDYEVTIANSGFDITIDSDIDNSFGENTSQNINLGPGEDDMTWDIGLFKCATIGDLIWRDVIQNDIYDNIEGGIDGVLINLWRKTNGTWTLWDNTFSTYAPFSTCGSGFWSFCTNPGEYYIEFVGMGNANYLHVLPHVGNDDEIDSDVDDSYGLNTTGSYVLQSGDVLTNVDAGFYQDYTISGQTWIDLDENGVRSGNESVYPDIEVQLYNSAGLVATTISDNIGYYSFENLLEDSYYLLFDLPTNYHFTIPNVGPVETDSDVTDDNGANTTTWLTIVDEDFENIDAGYVFDNSSGMIWNGVGGENLDEYNEIWWDTKNDVQIDHYEVQNNFEENDFFNILETINSNKQSSSSYSVQDYNITKVGTYRYKIKAVDINGENTYSKEIFIDVDAEIGFSVSPNPTSDFLNVEYLGSEQEFISIYITDLQGKLFYKKENIEVLGRTKYNDKLDISILNDGIYQFLIKTKSNSYITKFVKISY